MPAENRITLTPDTPVRYLKGVGPKTGVCQARRAHPARWTADGAGHRRG